MSYFKDKGRYLLEFKIRLRYGRYLLEFKIRLRYGRYLLANVSYFEIMLVKGRYYCGFSHLVLSKVREVSFI